MLFNTTSFENHLEEIEECADMDDSTKEYLADMLRTCYSIYTACVDNGVLPYTEEDEELDLELLTTAVDSLVGEISAATLTMSAYPGVVEELEGVYHKLRTHPQNAAVPTPVIQGFKKLAERIKADERMLNQD